MSTVNKICWNELNTRDQKAAQEFYGALFGWEFETMPAGESDYIMARLGDEYVAGFFDLSSLPMLDGVPDHWFTYIGVEDIEATVEATLKAGGSIRRPVFEVGGGMKIAILVDATGAVFGVNQNGG